MTLRVTEVLSAQYNEHNREVFTVNCGDFETTAIITGRPQDAYNDRLLRIWLADSSNTVSAHIPDPEPIPVPPEELMQQERAQVFSSTIDKMNPIWFSSLTSTQQENLTTWRQEWLDYPATSNRPDNGLIEGIFN